MCEIWYLAGNFGIGLSLLKDLTWSQGIVVIVWGIVIWIHSKVNLRWRSIAKIYRARHDRFSGVLVTRNGGIAIMQQSIVLIPQNSKSYSVTHWLKVILKYSTLQYNCNFKTHSESLYYYCYFKYDGSTVRLLTHVLYKRPHFVFQLLIATMSNSIQTSFNRVMKD